MDLKHQSFSKITLELVVEDESEDHFLMPSIMFFDMFSVVRITWSPEIEEEVEKLDFLFTERRK